MSDTHMNSFERDDWPIRNKFTIITFLCSILVIYIHTFNLEVYGITEGASGLAAAVYGIETYFNGVTKIAVPMFFFVSGVLFFRTFEIRRLPEKWKSRVMTIVIPYLVWCTLYYLYFVVCSKVPLIRELTGGTVQVDFSASAWLMHLWPESYYTLWFLQNLMIFILLAPVIWLCLKNHLKKHLAKRNGKPPTGLIALILLETALALWGGRIPHATGLDVYLAGAYIGLNCREWFAYRNRALSLLSCGVIAIMLLTDLRYWNTASEVLLFLSIWFALDLVVPPPDWICAAASLVDVDYLLHLHGARCVPRGDGKGLVHCPWKWRGVCAA